MTWHEDLSLEVHAEFARLAATPWSRIEDRFWQYHQEWRANWSEHGQWWRKTTAGRRYDREYKRMRAALLKSVIVSVRTCIACGRSFELNAYREKRGKTRVCSTACRGAARKNIERIRIDGKLKTLTAWAEHYGLDLKTVWMRKKRGWDVHRALTTPLRDPRAPRGPRARRAA